MSAGTPGGRGAEFRAGLVAVAPLALGSVPFGLIYGVLAVKAGMPPWLAIAVSSVVFAGSAQFMITQLVAGGAPAAVIVASVFTINLRHALYSASVAQALAHLPRRWKMLLAYLLTDEAFAAAAARFESDVATANRHWYLLGAGLGLWILWQACTVAGVLLGGSIPAGWSLEFAGTLTFVAIVVSMLRDRAAWIAMACAGGVAVAAHALPYKLSIVLAALVGIAAGWAVAGRREDRA